MRPAMLGTMRANVVLFAISVAIVEVVAVLVLAASRHLDLFNDDITRLIVLVASFALAIATKIQARTAFEAAVSKGYLTQATDGCGGSRLVVADECPGAWLVQLHIESCAEVSEACQSREETKLQ